MFTDKTIAFIGSGVMGEAMIRGLITRNIVSPGQIIASDPHSERLKTLHERHTIHTTQDNRHDAEAGDIIVLSIKPQELNHVKPEIRGHFQRQDLLRSIIAGAPILRLTNVIAN